MAGHLSTWTLPASFPNTRWPRPSDCSVYLYLKGGSFVQMLLIFNLKPGRVTTASINPWSIMPASLPSRPRPFLGCGSGFGPLAQSVSRVHLPWVSAASYLDRCSWLHLQVSAWGLISFLQVMLGFGGRKAWGPAQWLVPPWHLCSGLLSWTQSAAS